MIKKKLSPLKKPSNFNQVTNNTTLVQCLSQLIKQQKTTNQLLQAHFNTSNKNPKVVHSIVNKHQQIMVSPNIPMKLSAINTPQRGEFQRDNKLTSLQSNYDNSVNFNFTDNQKEQNNKPNLLNITLQGQKVLKDALTKKISSQDNQKKNYNVLSQFLQYTDRRQFKILIDFQNASKDFPVISGVQVLQQITIQWIGDVLRMVASMCWNMMLNGFLSFQETKILFTQNVIYNYIEFMKQLQERQFGVYKHRLTSLMNKKSVNILDFLGRQYPQTKIDAPNIRLKEILPNINNSSRLKFDIITIANRKGFQLKYKQKGNYSGEVMQIINFMIDETNQEYQAYQKQCLHIFQQIFRVREKRSSPKEGNTPLTTKNAQKFDSTDDLMYRQKVKKYTKFLIGRKINKNVPKYSRQQINNGVFFPKSPSILRILTKWVQELTDVIKDPQAHIFSADQQLKSHDGDLIVLFSAVRRAVCQKIIEKRPQFFKKIQGIKEECFYIESILSSPKYTSDSTQSHLSQDQISVGKFSAYLQKAISSYIFQQLNQIIHFLLSIPAQVDENNIGVTEDFYRSEIRKQLDKLNLITMKIFDLLRCKCISNEEDIMWIMKYLIQRNRVGDFKLVRVKDRLSEGTRDINCNLRFSKGGMLSEMQLSVVSNIQTKQQKLDSYNHFLYELKRSKLGPLSQNVSIWTVLQQRSLYFQNTARNPIPLKPTLHNCSNDNLEKFNRPISCQSCDNFYPYPQTCYSNVKCKSCKKTFCGDCYSTALNQDEKKRVIFKGLFKQPAIDHIICYDDPQKPFPMEGIYFKRYHQKKQVNFFTLLIKDSQSQQPLSYQSVKQLSSKQNQIQVEILFTHNSIRNGKTIQKQKNIKNIIKAKFIHGKGLFINKKDYTFFNQYVIFYFDDKFHSSTMTLDQIQTFLKTQQNHKVKVLNITQDPVYVDQVQYLRKKSEKLRELYKLKSLFENNPSVKFLVYQFKSTFIVAKVYKDPITLGLSINYDNNIAKLKQFARTQRSIVSMEKHNLKDEIKNLEIQLHPKLVQSLQYNLRKIYLNYNGLTSVQGLKKFIYLQVLYLRHNLLVDLQGLEDMKQMIVLRFDDNQVQSLQPLANMVALKRLMGIDNRIKSIQPVRNIKLLKTIQFERNQIQTLEAIKQLKDLQDLNFKSNPKLQVLPFFESKRIKTMNFSKTIIQDFSSFDKYTKVSRLLLQNLKLKQVPSFIKNMQLSELWLSHNEIQKMENLQGQVELQIISLKDNKLTSIENLQTLDKIKTLFLDNNQITSLHGIKCVIQTLKHISIKQNPLTDIKELMFTDETFKFQFTKQKVAQNVNKFYQELFINKVMSSGSQD